MRDCGSCHYCCVVYSIEELNKWSRRPCEHLCINKNGCCSIHKQERPKACTEYHCMWKEGLLDKAERPDKVDAVFHLGPADGRGRGADKMVMAWTMNREVWQSKTPARLIAERLAEQHPTILRPGPFNGKDIIGPWGDEPEREVDPSAILELLGDLS